MTIDLGMGSVLAQHTFIVLRLAGEVSWWMQMDIPAKWPILAQLVDRLTRAQEQERVWERLVSRHVRTRSMRGRTR